MAGPSHGKILIVDDTVDIATMLQFYFNAKGFQTRMVHRGGDALTTTRQWTPNLILLDINMPDMDGYDVCRQLRANLRTSHVPIIFLTEKTDKHDKLRGLELGVDDYITKPFDLEELHLRALNTLRRAGQETYTHPVTGLPGARLIEEHLKHLLRQPTWALAMATLNHFSEFNNVYGFVAGDDALKTLAMILADVLTDHGTPNDFLGHIGGPDFLFTTLPDHLTPLTDALLLRFARDIPLLYSYQDRKAGYMTLPHGAPPVPLMSLSIGVVTSAHASFTDIRELSEAATEARQRARLATGSSVYIER
jgi:PleD family two-component response regulator